MDQPASRRCRLCFIQSRAAISFIHQGDSPDGKTDRCRHQWDRRRWRLFSRLACDFRVLGQSAVLRQAYTSSGLSIDGGGSFALPRLVGLARAMEIMTFDNPISAAQALDWGMVTNVVPDEAVLTEALVMLETITKGAHNSFAWSKKLIANSFNNTLETQLEWERDGISDCAAHPNGQEGIRAFLEKRKPSFQAPP